MESIKEIGLPIKALPKLKKVRDLIYFEGPLLSHYQSEYGKDYLFYWADSDDIFNRWLVIGSSIEDIEKYLRKEKTLHSFFSESSTDVIYKVDINRELEFKNLSIVDFEDLPESYIPQEESYFTGYVEPIQGKLAAYSRSHSSGVLQAHFKNSSKVGIGFIELELLGSSLSEISDINKGLRKAFIRLEKERHAEGKSKERVDEASIISASSFYYVGHMAASFGAMFKPVSMQSTIPGLVGMTDRYMEFFIGFLKSSTEKGKFLEFMKLLDKSVLDNFKNLLSIVEKSKIQLNFNYLNYISNINLSKEISWDEARDTISLIEELDYDEEFPIELVGRFTSLNLKTGHYSFETVIEGNEMSSGYLDDVRKEMSWKIKWDKLYRVKISRKETKKTGRKHVSIKDTINSFVEVEDFSLEDT